MPLIDKFKVAKPLVAFIRQALAANEPPLVEDLLERYQAEADGYQHRLRQLMAIRFYLQELLWEITNSWLTEHAHITSYSGLVDRVEQWRSASGETVAYVSFNYDLLLEDGASLVTDFEPLSMQDYIGHTPFSLLKPHGSANWGRSISGGVDQGSANDDAQLVIQSAPELQVTEEYFVTRTSSGPLVKDIYYPAVAIPVRSKQRFEVPSTHIDHFKKQLSKTHRQSRVLIVGWRGTEEAFVRILAEHFNGNPLTLVVAGGEELAKETIKNLRARGLDSWRYITSDLRFGNLLPSADLDRFLASES